MQISIGERIAATRRQQFVGREAETRLLRSVLTAPELPFSLLYLYGPGGVGKTALLQSFATLCKTLAIPAYRLDARNVEASPEAFSDALRTVLNLPDSADPIAFLGAVPERCVLFLDTVEMLDAITPWLRDVLLPQISVNVLVVAAGRYSPANAWALDAAWQSVFHAVPLQNFTETESAAYLSQRAVPAGVHSGAYHFTHGHPLALSLVADLYAQSPPGDEENSFFTPDATPPEVVQILLKRFLEESPSGIKKQALEMCALVRGTNEALLQEILFRDAPEEVSSDTDPGSLFRWLRGLSFMDSGPSGLFPHDITREAILADLRWRNPDWYVELHRRARLYYTRQLQKNTSPGMQKRFLHDCLFLHRDNEIVRAAFTWNDIPAIVADALRPGDTAALLAMVARHEGEESATIAGHWLAASPEATTVFRDSSKSEEPVAFFTMLPLHKASAADIAHDPATRTAWEYMARQSALRSGEGATYLRFWMTRDAYQKTSPLQSLLIVHALHHFLTQGQRLAYTFFCCHDTATWQSVFDYAHIARVPAAFTLDERRYSVFGHDWRTTPLMAWIARMAEKEIDAASVYHAFQKADASRSAPDFVEAAQPSLPSPPRPVLDAEAFAAAVRDTLRDFNTQEMLLQNPLLHARFVRDAALRDSADPVLVLRDAVRQAVDSLNTPSIRSQRGFRVLHHTYLHPHISQEETAKLLDLPFSTYRRHLAEGIAAVVAILWRQETGGR